MLEVVKVSDAQCSGETRTGQRECQASQIGEFWTKGSQDHGAVCRILWSERESLRGYLLPAGCDGGRCDHAASEKLYGTRDRVGQATEVESVGVESTYRRASRDGAEWIGRQGAKLKEIGRESNACLIWWTLWLKAWADGDCLERIGMSTFVYNRASFMMNLLRDQNRCTQDCSDF